MYLHVKTNPFNLIAIIIICICQPLNAENSILALTSKDQPNSTTTKTLTELNALITRSRNYIKSDPALSAQLAIDALKRSNESNNQHIKLQASLILGDISTQEKNYGRAETHYLKALEIASKTNEYSKENEMLIALIGLANTLVKQNKIENVDNHIHQALNIALEKNNLKQLLRIQHIKADRYRLQNNHQKTITAYQDALQIAIQTRNIAKQASFHAQIAILYKKLKEYKLAMMEYKNSSDKYLLLKDIEKSAKQATNMAHMLTHLQQIPEAINTLKKFIELTREANNQILLAKLLTETANTEKKINNYVQALKHTNEALLIYDQTDNIKDRALTLNVTGIIHLRLKQFHHARDYFTQTLNLPIEKVRSKDRASALRELSFLLLLSKEYDKALIHANEALSIYQDSKDINGMSTANRRIGQIYFAQKKYDLALKAHEKSYIQAKESHYKWAEAKALRFIGEILIITDLDRSIETLKKGLKIAEENSAKDVQVECYAMLAIAESKRDNFKSAYDYSELKYTLALAINTEEANKAASQMKMMRDADRREAEIESLRKQANIDELKIIKNNTELEVLMQNKEISKLRNKTSRYIRLALGLAIIILLGIIFLLFVRSRNEIKNRIILDEKNTNLNELNDHKDRFFTIIAHDLRGPISAVASLSELMKEELDNLDKQAIRTYTESIHETAKTTFSLLEELLAWAIVQIRHADPAPSICSSKEIIQHVFATLTPIAENKHIKLTLESHDEHILYADKNMIITVIRNIISNGIKFTPENGEIKVITRKTLNAIIIAISDSGIGMSKDVSDNLFNINKNHPTLGTGGEKGHGLGLAISRDILEKNHGSIEVTSQIGLGSTFTITLPVDKH